MIVDPKSSGRYDIRADLISNKTVANKLKRSYYTCQMSFKYYMLGKPYTSTPAFFAVSNNGLNYNPVWRTTVKTTNAWTPAKAAIGEHVSHI